MSQSLPRDVAELYRWTWQDFEPFYKGLADDKFEADTVDDWLKRWTALDECVSELSARLEVATTQNTADAEADARYNRFLETIFPNVEAAEQMLRENLLASGLTPAGFDIPLKKMRADADLFRAANVPLLTEERKLAMEYDKIIGAQSVEFEGRELTISQLRPVYQDGNRVRRETAWRTAANRQLADRESISRLWVKLLGLRIKLAQNVGKKDYRDYRWEQRHRFDYTPDDCKRFHDAIEQVVVPAAKRIYDKRRGQLGVDTLRPWDLDVDPLNRPPLRPFQDVNQLKAIGARIFGRVDPDLSRFYQIMAGEGLLDLDNRKNKAPGGYCTYLPMSKRPFIFMNGVGVHDDLQTLLHESGHAFHNFERSTLPYSQQRQVGAEFAEVASMSMELLAARYLAAGDGGAYSPEDAARARIEHLESDILFWPYMAVVDAFQHWVYENPDEAMDPGQCDSAWSREWDRFMGGIDWSGLEDIKMTGWQRKLHIHQYPFYYIEYGLAQLGAIQIWGNSRSDHAGAIASYRRALALGGTRSLPELYAEAGARLAFDAETLGDAVALAESGIAELEQNER